VATIVDFSGGGGGGLPGWDGYAIREGLPSPCGGGYPG